MANTYADATGVLMFDGPARITPVIRMLFTPFKLDETPEDSGSEHYVAILSEENNYDWDSFIDDVIHAAKRDFNIVFDEDVTPADAVKAIGAHFNAALDDLLPSIDFDNSVLLSDLVALALLLQDGHNLVGISLEGCWHCDKPRLWEFGGWSTFASARYILALSTADISAFARAMDTHTAEGVDETAKSVSAFVEALIDGIVDQRLRNEVVPRLVDLMRQKLPASGELTATSVQDAWKRTVHLQAYATDEGDDPGYARIDVTPHFIESLQSLRALCKERKLTQVRIANGPDEWRLGTSEEDLRLQYPTLVVTPWVFWFTDQPRHMPFKIETACEDIDRFVEAVSGPGDPLYIGIDREDVEDQKSSES